MICYDFVMASLCCHCHGDNMCRRVTLIIKFDQLISTPLESSRLHICLSLCFLYLEIFSAPICDMAFVLLNCSGYFYLKLLIMIESILMNTSHNFQILYDSCFQTSFVLIGKPGNFLPVE